MDELWAHSVKVGAQAAMLAKRQPGLDADVALVAGLVHDIGHIPLLIKACNYELLIKKPEVLDKILHKLHTQLGGSILKLWKFDDQVRITSYNVCYTKLLRMAKVAGSATPTKVLALPFTSS